MFWPFSISILVVIFRIIYSSLNYLRFGSKIEWMLATVLPILQLLFLVSDYTMYCYTPIEKALQEFFLYWNLTVHFSWGYF